jgi:para-aminobenzoate synthetase
MQVHVASQLFRVPRIGSLVHKEDAQPFKEAFRRSQLLGNANVNCLSISSALKFPESSINVRHLKLKWRKFDKLVARVGGARNIFNELFGVCKAENTFWLDSSSVEKVLLLNFYSTLLSCLLFLTFPFRDFDILYFFLLLNI